MLGPVIAAEVAVGGAGRDDQEVVLEPPPVAQMYGGHIGVQGDRLVEQHSDVLLPAEDLADGRGDVGCRQPRGGHLVQQWMEKVMILPVDERGADGSIGQRFCALEAGEASAEDHDVRSAIIRHARKLATRGAWGWPFCRSSVDRDQRTGGPRRLDRRRRAGAGYARPPHLRDRRTTMATTIDWYYKRAS